MNKNNFAIFFISSFLIIILVLLKLNVNGSEIQGFSNSIITMTPNQENSDNDSVHKFIEFINISYNKDEEYLLYIDGWTSDYLSSEKEGPEIPKNELTSAYFQYNIQKYPIIIKTGRFYVNQGIAKMEQIDGFYEDLTFKNNFNLSLYQGVPTETENDNRNDDSIFGGRFSKAWENDAEIGISFLNEINSNSNFRKELGVDLYYGFHTNAFLSGRLDYNLESERIATHNYLINYFPNQYFVITEEYKKDYFKHIFPSSTSGIFTNLENEESERWKTFMDITPTGDYSLTLEYETYTFNLIDTVRYYGAELRYRMLTENSYGFSINRMDAGRDQNSFNQVREFMRIDGDKNVFSIDAYQLFYSKLVYNHKQAYQVMLTAGRKFNNHLSLYGTIEYDFDAFYEYAISSAIKLNYLF